MSREKFVVVKNTVLNQIEFSVKFDFASFDLVYRFLVIKVKEHYQGYKFTSNLWEHFNWVQNQVGDCLFQFVREANVPRESEFFCIKELNQILEEFNLKLSVAYLENSSDFKMTSSDFKMNS